MLVLVFVWLNSIHNLNLFFSLPWKYKNAQFTKKNSERFNEKKKSLFMFWGLFSSKLNTIHAKLLTLQLWQSFCAQFGKNFEIYGALYAKNWTQFNSSWMKFRFFFCVNAKYCKLVKIIIYNSVLNEYSDVSVYAEKNVLNSFMNQRELLNSEDWRLYIAQNVD